MAIERGTAAEDGGDRHHAPALAGSLGYLLGQAHLVHRRVAEARLAPLGLRGKEFGALTVLVGEGAMSQQRLGERMGVDRTTMVAVVDGLQRGGLVERERDPTDRRAYVLRATPSGRRVLRRATEAVERAEADFLAGIAPAERGQLKRLLRDLLARRPDSLADDHGTGREATAIAATSEDARAWLAALCHALPEVSSQGDQHLQFQVRGRTFAYFLDDHHGDGRVALCCKAGPGEQEALIAADPERFYRPTYLGARGWVAVRLDRDDVDWDEVGELVREAYRLTAPKRLAAMAEA